MAKSHKPAIFRLAPGQFFFVFLFLDGTSMFDTKDSFTEHFYDLESNRKR